MKNPKVLKFKKQAAGQYTAEYKGYKVVVTKDYDAGWDGEITCPEGYSHYQENFTTLREAKMFTNFELADK